MTPHNPSNGSPFRPPLLYGSFNPNKSSRVPEHPHQTPFKRFVSHVIVSVNSGQPAVSVQVPLPLEPQSPPRDAATPFVSSKPLLLHLFSSLTRELFSSSLRRRDTFELVSVSARHPLEVYLFQRWTTDLDTLRAPVDRWCSTPTAIASPI